MGTKGVFMSKLAAFGLLSTGMGLAVAGCARNEGESLNKALPAVTVSHPIEKEVADYAEYTGRTAAVKSVTIVPRATGYIVRVPFKEGTEVKKNDLLFEIDPRTYQTQVEQAKAQVALNEAQLRLAQSIYERDRLAGSAVTPQQLDIDLATVSQNSASLKAAQALLATNQLNLEFTHVTSPIDGRVSSYFLTLGNLAVQDQTRLTTVVSQDPMYAYFDADEPTVLHVRDLIREGKLASISQEGARIPIYLGLTNEDGFPHAGYLDFANNQFTASTATLRVRGVFSNPQPDIGDRALAPAMFVRVQVPISPTYRAILVSQAAVGTDQEVEFVYVLDEDDKVVRKDVKLGTLHDGLQAIESGVELNDRLIVLGLQHVKPGEKVSPRLVPMPIPSKGSSSSNPRAAMKVPAPSGAKR
jgi:multidrug efflux system membrane fusion protein